MADMITFLHIDKSDEVLASPTELAELIERANNRTQVAVNALMAQGTPPNPQVVAQMQPIIKFQGLVNVLIRKGIFSITEYEREIAEVNADFYEQSAAQVIHNKLVESLVPSRRLA